MSILSIKSNNLKQPSTLIFMYLIGLSFTFLFVDKVGQSTLIDELLLLAMLPAAVVGIFKYYFTIGLPARLILVYFTVAVFSSVVTLATRSDIPFAAPVLGIILDTKLLIFLGALLFLAGRCKKTGEEIILNVCKVILFLGLMNSVFFLRDIFSGGTSLSGIRLGASNIIGYVPVGLFSHKVNAALLCSISFSAAFVLYLFTRERKFILCTGFFLVFLFFASSLKELGVILAMFIILLRALNNRKNKVSNTSKKLLMTAIVFAPIMAFVFGSALDKLVTSRVNVYVFEENARAALHVKSAEIANDYFPLGSGAGTYSSQPSRSMYYSPLYYEYGIAHYYGASAEYSSFLMDVGWPKFIAESGWLGGGAYFFAYLVSFLGLAFSFLRRPTAINVFGIMVGSIIFSSALGSAVFTGEMGLMVCALLFTCAYLDRKQRAGC